MDSTTTQLRALPASGLLAVVGEWEYTISWFRAHAGEAQLNLDGCHPWQIKTKVKMKQAMQHYDGCIRQLERCCDDVRNLIAAN